jgi:hypothetical protein
MGTTIENVRAVAASAKQATAASLNAAHEAWALLQAERNGTAPALMQQAAIDYDARHGCGMPQAYLEVGRRGVYLKELASGDKMFIEAKRKLDASDDASAMVSTFAASP